ncbi:MAG: hypothetical protein NTW14_04325 [bacterium]|nr:hypothetical protein [bacterium]
MIDNNMKIVKVEKRSKGIAMEIKPDFQKPTMDIEADALALRCGLDKHRVRSIYYQLNDIQWWDPFFPWNTTLDVAFSFGNPDKILTLFESEDLFRLRRKVNLVEYFSHPMTPLYRISRLKVLTKRFIEYLMNNKNILLETGFPRDVFAMSPWMECYLANLYYYKLPLFGPDEDYSRIIGDKRMNNTGAYEATAQLIGSNGEPYYNYVWIKEQLPLITIEADKPHLLPFFWHDGKAYTLKGKRVRPCSYKSAQLINGINRNDANWLDTLRPKLFDVKITILSRLEVALEEGNIRGLWHDCLNLITDKIMGYELDKLSSIDKVYSNLNAGGIFTFSPIGRNWIHHSSGLFDLFEMVGHFEKEIKIGTMDKIAERLFHTDNDQIPESYYQLIDENRRIEIDGILDLYFNLEQQEIQYWKEYSDRVNAALENEFFEEILIRQKVKRPLAAKYEPAVRIYSDFIKAHLECTGQLPHAGAILTEPVEFRLDTEKLAVWLRGKKYELTEPQFKVVKYLHEQYQAGDPVCQNKIVIQNALGITYTESDLNSMFKSRPEAWKELFIRPHGKIRLNLPDLT